MKRLVPKPNFDQQTGLVTVVVQDARSKEVLMVEQTNELGWRTTLASGIATYYSTSLNKTWAKGEGSDKFQQVIGIRVRCGGDALIYLLEPQPTDRTACHTGAWTCFYQSAVDPDDRDDAPHAGTGEEFPLVELEVCESIRGWA